MKYTKEIKSSRIEDALSLEKTQVDRLKKAIQKAYDQEWHPEGPNVDQIYDKVAPYIKSQEEAFYVANVVLTDVLGMMATAAAKG